MELLFGFTESGVLGQGSSSEARPSNMMSSRKRRLRSPSPPAVSDGTDAGTRDLEPTNVRHTHDLSLNLIVDLSLEMSSPDHESEESNSRRSEELVTPASPVPETECRTPLDETEARVMPMSSILARARPAQLWLRPNLNQKSKKSNILNVDLLPSTELRLGHAITALPTIKIHRAGDEIFREDEDTGDDSVGSEDEQRDAHVIMSSGESSDLSLEARYIRSWRESPSVSSRRQGRRAAFKRAKAIALQECQSIHRETNTAHPSHMKYYSRNPSWDARRNVDMVEASAPAAGSRGHNLRSSNVNDDQEESGEAPEEGSLLHAVYCVVLVCGGDGISEEDVLVSLHGQSRPATTAHADWEADVKQCLKSRLFAQVQDRYILRKHRRQTHPSASSKGKEKNSHSSGESGMEGRRKVSRNGVEGRVSVSNVKDEGLGGRGSLKALQDKIDEEQGAEGARRCSLKTSLHRKVPWQCPLTAMEDHKLCEHHFKRAEVTKLKARMKTKSMKDSNFGL